MAQPLDLSGKRSFLIALPSQADRELLAGQIATHIDRSHFFYAADGAEALRKILNAPPHVALLDHGLTKSSAFQVAQSILSDKNLDNTALVLLAPLPAKEQFVDEVVTGRIQFLEDWLDTDQLARVLSKALNYLTRETPKEFNLRFLAPGEVLLKEGEKGEHVYIVQRGELEAFIIREGKRQVLGKIAETEFVGEMAYIDHEPRSADVVALTDCELIEIPIDLLDQMLFRKPAWTKALMRTLSKRVKRSNQSVRS